MTAAEARARAADHLAKFSTYTLWHPDWAEHPPDDWHRVQAVAEAAWAWACVVLDLEAAEGWLRIEGRACNIKSQCQFGTGSVR